MPVERGNRPASRVACPGAVSVMAWSWCAFVNDGAAADQASDAARELGSEPLQVVAPELVDRHEHHERRLLRRGLRVRRPRQRRPGQGRARTGGESHHANVRPAPAVRQGALGRHGATGRGARYFAGSRRGSGHELQWVQARTGDAGGGAVGRVLRRPHHRDDARLAVIYPTARTSCPRRSTRSSAAREAAVRGGAGHPARRGGPRRSPSASRCSPRCCSRCRSRGSTC